MKTPAKTKEETNKAEPIGGSVHPFRAVRRAGVPLCVFESADPAQTIKACVKSMNGRADTQPVLTWDIVQGLFALNKPGASFLQNNFADDAALLIGTQNPSECLKFLADKAPKDAVVFWHNAHRTIENESVAQGIWNLRDKFKLRHGTLVMLAPNLTLPSELKHDAIIITDALPGERELGDVLDQTAKDAAGPDATGPVPIENRDVVIDILRGLSAFAAEQVLAMSISPNGVDMDGLWQRKRKMIEQTPGLAVWTGGETFADLGGLDNLKGFLTRVLTSGNTPVRAIGFIDEIEKGLAGSAGDTSGTSQDQLQVFLKVMQDLNIPGIILLGHAGTGKSAIAKAAGQVAQCPVIAIDTGAMKGSLVGSSEARIRAAMEVFKAVSQGKGLFIATCNKIASLPPELRRRFTLGTFFVDLPTQDERNVIWNIWLKRYDLKTGSIPEDTGWTGAEVKACCEVAHRTGLPLKEAAQFVVPITKSAADQVAALRNQAAGRFISASYAGVYQLPEQREQNAESGRRMEN